MTDGGGGGEGEGEGEGKSNSKVGTRWVRQPCPSGTTDPYQANYKPLRLAGTARLIPPRDSTSFMGPVFIGTASIVGPDLGAPPQTGVFCTKHFADMRLAEANPW